MTKAIRPHIFYFVAPILDIGQILNTDFPTTAFSDTCPKLESRLSKLLGLLSPITNTYPSSTVIGNSIVGSILSVIPS